jgi:small subunit ribosomal protein S16
MIFLEINPFCMLYVCFLFGTAQGSPAQSATKISGEIQPITSNTLFYLDFGGFMATTLRMQRHGNAHRPFYHIVAANSRASATKKFLEKIGYYDAATEPSTVVVDEDRLRYWYGVGATVSNTLKVLLVKKGIKLERIQTTAPRTGAEKKAKAPKAAVKKAAPKAVAKKPAK